MPLKQLYTLCGLLFITLCFILPQTSMDGYFWEQWALGLNQVPFYNCYSIPRLNYNPLYIYVLKAYTLLAGSNEVISHNLNSLKIITLLFDFGAIVLLQRWLHKNGKNVLLSFFILFNIAYLYNTLYWGQIDAIHTALVFAAFVAGLNGRLLWSVLAFVLAVNVKTQSLLFMPILGLLYIPLLVHTPRKTLLKTALVCLIVQGAVFLPFILHKTYHPVYYNFVNAGGQYKYISMNAYNVWCLLLWQQNPDGLCTASNKLLAYGLPYKNWGLYMFAIAAVIVALPLLLKAVVLLVRRQKFEFKHAEQVFLSLAIIALVFFYFLTQMHERYSHPAVLFMGVYFVLSKRWWLFLLTSYAYLINMERVARCWKLTNYNVFIFDPKLIAALFGLVIVLGTVRLYRSYGIKNDWVGLKKSLFNKHRAIQ